MKALTKLLIAPLCILLVFSILGCASVERVSSDDPFSQQLDIEYANRQNAQNWMLTSAIALVIGVIGGTVCTTLGNISQLNQTAAIVGIVTSYSLSRVGAGVGTVELLRWNRAFDEYLETLRLQSQYYNTIEWTKKNPD